MHRVLKYLEMKTVRFHDSFICQNVPDYEQYAYMYSKSVAEAIFQNDDFALDQYVKIQSNTKTIYRKCAAWRTIKKNEISLGNRSIRELGFKSEDLGYSKVEVTKSNWLSYQIHNSDRSQKAAFLLALIGFICAVLSSLKDIFDIVLLW